MFKTKTSKDNVLHRMKIIQGHLSKISEMIDHDAYCIDVLTQTKAVKRSLEKVDEVLLEHHLSHCVVDHIQHGQTKKAVDEVMKVFKKSH